MVALAGKDQRGSPRSGFISFVWYKRVGEVEEGAPTEGLARSCDVSDQGVGLVTSRPVSAGALLFLEIATQAGGVSAVGRVMHCRTLTGGDAYRLGVRLEVVPPGDRATLAKIIERSR